jgi:hypothetical protein
MLKKCCCFFCLFCLFIHFKPKAAHKGITLLFTKKNYVRKKPWYLEYIYHVRHLNWTRNVSIGHGCPHRDTVLSILWLYVKYFLKTKNLLLSKGQELYKYWINPQANPKFKIANLYYCKSRAITLTKMKKIHMQSPRFIASQWCESLFL